MKIWKLGLKISLWLIGIGIFCYVLVICFLIFGPRIKSHSEQIPFESSQWKAHLETKDSIKLKMVDNLLSAYELIGMDVSKIDQLLGKPPKTNYFQEYDYVYWLGPERGAFGIDSEWLGIKFDNGIVTKADILRD